MRIKAITIFFVVAIFSNAAYSDTVDQVFSCGNDVGIKTNADGWLVVKESEIGIDRVNRIMSIALTLLSTQKPIGTYDASSPALWCGIPNAKTITLLAIKAG